MVNMFRVSEIPLRKEGRENMCIAIGVQKDLRIQKD